MKFKDQIVIVTGGTRGIGKQIALSFAEEGAFVIILGRNEQVVNETVVELSQSKGLKVEGYPCDVTNSSKVQEILNKILDKHKNVDILVNNAGITRDNLLLRMSENDWDDVISINLKGVFNCTKAVSKVMLRAHKGKIINITSIIGIIGNAGQANYAASKAGVIGFTKSIAKELASRNINVNAIAPGYIETEMTAQLKDNVREEILKDIPLARLGQAKDIAGVCLFLASEQASYITGQTIVVDGGMAI
jgi:3-oxoacyl-[acyl-carrier protein] reductase